MCCWFLTLFIFFKGESDIPSAGVGGTLQVSKILYANKNIWMSVLNIFSRQYMFNVLFAFMQSSSLMQGM